MNNNKSSDQQWQIQNHGVVQSMHGSQKCERRECPVKITFDVQKYLVTK